MNRTDHASKKLKVRQMIKWTGANNTMWQHGFSNTCKNNIGKGMPGKDPQRGIWLSKDPTTKASQGWDGGGRRGQGVDGCSAACAKAQEKEEVVCDWRDCRHYCQCYMWCSKIVMWIEYPKRRRGGEVHTSKDATLPMTMWKSVYSYNKRCTPTGNSEYSARY